MLGEIVYIILGHLSTLAYAIKSFKTINKKEPLVALHFYITFHTVDNIYYLD